VLAAASGQDPATVPELIQEYLSVIKEVNPDGGHR